MHELKAIFSPTLLLPESKGLGKFGPKRNYFEFFPFYSCLSIFIVFLGRRHIVDQFKDPHGMQEEEGPQFNNLVVDKNTGRVYIGAVNSLFQLSPNLQLMVC